MNAPVAIVDCNNFYASCERIFNPELKGKPIVVLSNNDGIIVARSQEAKDIGIAMGQPLFKIKDMMRKYDIRVFSSNYVLYGDMSNRVMTTLEQFTPDVEIYSIDEAFLNLGGFERMDLDEYAREIRRKMYQWTGIQVSIGVASTKTLSKIANRFAKKNKEYEGVLSLMNARLRREVLEKTDVYDIWGVGRQYGKLLKKHGINNAYELSIADQKWVKKRMTVMGLRTVYELNGIPCISYEYAPPPKKAIVSSRSFGKAVTELRDVKEAAALFVSRATEKMREQNSATTMLSVFIRTNPFKNSRQYHNGVLAKIKIPTDSTAELLHYAMKGIDQIYRKGYQYQKVGVMLSGFAQIDKSQLALFDTKDRVKMSSITETVDKINLQMGKETVFYASTGINRDWGTKFEHRSDRFTTNWHELPKVKAGVTLKKQLEMFKEINLRGFQQ
jgi:DNA polymerase V